MMIFAFNFQYNQLTVFVHPLNTSYAQDTYQANPDEVPESGKSGLKPIKSVYLGLIPLLRYFVHLYCVLRIAYCVPRLST